MKLSPIDRESVISLYKSGLSAKIIAHEFGISRSHVSKVATRHGASHRYRNFMRNQAPVRIDDGIQGRILALFRAGRDTFSISRTLGQREHVVANLLANARERERGQ